MDRLKIFFVLAYLFSFANAKCPWKGSTLCFNDSPKLISTGISKSEKQTIVKLHNKYRSQADPPASDLMVLIWDDKIAEVAQKLANQCRLFHDKDRRVPHYGVHIGQNIAVGYSSWSETVESWYSEKKKFKYGIANSMMKVGHFTQILYEKTSRVGCGFSQCTNGNFYVCNYGSGQMNYAFKTPYKTGKPCGDCPDTCANGLCDCKGKLCLNNGKIHPNTCKCECLARFSGENCETLDCDKPDIFLCPKIWKPDFCLIYANVPALCPHMCKKCRPSKK